MRSTGGSESVTCSPPPAPSEVPRVHQLFESETQIVYTSLPFSGSGNTTCWHLVTAGNCTSNSTTANFKMKLQVLRAVKAPTEQHAFEVVSQVDVAMNIGSAGTFCSQPQTISFAAKLEYSDGHFPGIYFKSISGVGVAYGGKFISCSALNSATPVAMWNRGKRQKAPEGNFSFTGAAGEVCFHTPLFTGIYDLANGLLNLALHPLLFCATHTVSVISERNDVSSTLLPFVLPSSPAVENIGGIVATTATPSTVASEPPSTSAMVTSEGI